MKSRIIGSACLCACLFLLAACSIHETSTVANGGAVRNASANNSAANNLMVTPGGSSTTATGPGANDVLVTLTDYAVHSTRTIFATGVRYHFIVMNKSLTLHEFMIGRPAMGSLSMAQMNKMALVHIPTIQPGRSATLDLTFTRPATAGTLEISCHLFHHYQAGMKLHIAVAKATLVQR